MRKKKIDNENVAGIDEPRPSELIAASPEAPKADSPAVLALQDDIVALVRQRSAVNLRIVEANAKAVRAQAELGIVQSELGAIDSEVQYRMGVIRQMKGEVAPPAIYSAAQVAPFPMGNQWQASISSEPTRPSPGVEIVEEGGVHVNRGHATRSMI